MDYLNQLDDSQREAVLYDNGPSLVVAGAGSGKTRVLTYKIVHLLSNGYQPHTILALTFTNKAAREMKHRIASLINEYSTRYLWMGTFHSIFYRILRREAQYIGFSPNFTIYDTADSRNLIKTILKELNLDEKVYRPGMVQSRISNAKNSLITCNAYVGNDKLMREDRYNGMPQIGEIYQWYQNRCSRAGAMDFDDLLLYTNILFRDHPEALAKYQNQFRYVLVDEYQDTNFAQHLIVARLCENHHLVFAVGDDAQSIYSFRGANIDNMLRFQENYPDCKVFKLEQNYRSTQNIVDAANSLIDKNKEQIRKTVYSKNDKGSKISVLSAYSDFEESYLVSCKIGEMMQRKGSAYADFAVLYRTNAQSRTLEEALNKRMIKYKIYGGQTFYQRKEIKDSLAYLRMIVNPSDEEALKRIINYPVRGIGETTINKLQHAAVAARVSLWEVIVSPGDFQIDISKGTVDKIVLFRELIQEMQQLNKEMNAAEIGVVALKMSGIHGNFIADKSFEGLSRLENVNELLNAMTEFVALRLEEGSNNVTLTDFLMEVSLMTDQDNDKDENADKVTLMTVHSAKGLEFKNVFIVGMENELFPSAHSLFNPKAIEEERRLFYVAITRAKENCFITYAEHRYRNGQSNTATPSFFIDDIDDIYLDYSEGIELPAQRWVKSSFDYDSDQDPFLDRRNEQKRNQEFDSDDSLNYSKRTYNKSWDADDYPKRFVNKYLNVEANLKRINKGNNAKDSSVTAQVTNVVSIGDFTIGDKVLHQRFGEGVIISMGGAGSDARLNVEFNNTGVKTLLLKYAKLRKV